MSEGSASNAAVAHLESQPQLFGKVLLVEDDSIVAEWICRKLTKSGVQCTVAKSFAEAEDVLSRGGIHAVVTDVYLEGGQPLGLRLVKSLEASGIPVLVVTSRADLQIAKEAMNSGASHLLEKPFTIEDLIGALKKMWEEPRGHEGILGRFMDQNGLTPKEKEIVRLLLKGLSNKEVAQISGNTEKTIKFHLTTIFQKCGVSSRTELFNAVFPT